MSNRCPVCGGNDANMSCAYPGEGRPGCWRDSRLADDEPATPGFEDYEEEAWLDRRDRAKECNR